MTYPCATCGQPSVYFSAGAYYCVQHPPVIEPNVVAPIDSRRYAQATDAPHLLARVEQLEQTVDQLQRIITKWGDRQLTNEQAATMAAQQAVIVRLSEELGVSRAEADGLHEELGALRTQLDNALRERDALSEIAGSLQEIVADLKAETEAMRYHIVERDKQLGWYDGEVRRLQTQVVWMEAGSNSQRAAWAQVLRYVILKLGPDADEELDTLAGERQMETVDFVLDTEAA